MTLVLLGLAACPKGTYVPPVTTIPADVPTPDEDGPVAGPRAVVELAPPPPVPEDTPGGGPLPPYLAHVRAQVGVLLDGCLASGAPTIATAAALVKARIGADGWVQAVEMVRSSGSTRYDSCLYQAFRSATLKPPPPEILAEDGRLATPEMAFR